MFSKIERKVTVLKPDEQCIPETGIGKIGERRGTKMIQGYQDLSYEERLKSCGLTTLEKRRSRGDLIGAYIIVTVIKRGYFISTMQGDSGAQVQLFKERKGTLGQKCFSAGAVDIWNELDDSTASVDSNNTIQGKHSNVSATMS